MSMLLKVICGTMFLLGMSWNIMAKGVIKGRVVDSQSKEVLVGATVNVEGYDSRVRHGCGRIF